MRIRDYNDTDKQELVSILSENVPKYFYPEEVAQFDGYLGRKSWDSFMVFVDDLDVPVGFSGYHFEDSGVLHITWMGFKPGSVGASNLKTVFSMFHNRLLDDLRRKSRNKIELDTTPRIARYLIQFGYVETSVVKDGYAPGYDKVFMECLVAK